MLLLDWKKKEKKNNKATNVVGQINRRHSVSPIVASQLLFPQQLTTVTGNCISAGDQCGLTVFLLRRAPGSKNENTAVIKRSVIAKLGDIGRDVSVNAMHEKQSMPRRK